MNCDSLYDKYHAENHCDNGDNGNYSNAVKSLLDCLREVKAWMGENNRLRLNDSKTDLSLVPVPVSSSRTQRSIPGPWYLL